MGWVLFFDGECGFCSASVGWVARLDPRGRIDFAPLQGKLAGELDFSRYASEESGTMVLLRESDGKVFFRSDAVIELAHALGGIWNIFALGRFIPKSFRDWTYRMIADHRSLFPGKSNFCEMPDAAVLKRIRE